MPPNSSGLGPVTGNTGNIEGKEVDREKRRSWISGVRGYIGSSGREAKKSPQQHRQKQQQQQHSMHQGRQRQARQQVQQQTTSSKQNGNNVRSTSPLRTNENGGGEDDDDDGILGPHAGGDVVYPLECYIPSYLKGMVLPYHGDFTYTPIFHPKLVVQLLSEGFLPIATSMGGGGGGRRRRGGSPREEYMLLPKLHRHRCVVYPLASRLHVSKSTRKKARRFRFTVNEAFEEVVRGCHRQHGMICWLYPPLVDAFRAIHRTTVGAAPSGDDELNLEKAKIMTAPFSPANASPEAAPVSSTQRTKDCCRVRLYSIEVWNAATGKLAGGELGYSVGSVYTSLTGFVDNEEDGGSDPPPPCGRDERHHHQQEKEAPPPPPNYGNDSAGSIQLAALGRLLVQCGFTCWDLGMDMTYKRSLGSRLMPRHQYVNLVRSVREKHDHVFLSLDQYDQQAGGIDARNVIDGVFHQEDEGGGRPNGKGEPGGKKKKGPKSGKAKNKAKKQPPPSCINVGEDQNKNSATNDDDIAILDTQRREHRLDATATPTVEEADAGFRSPLMTATAATTPETHPQAPSSSVSPPAVKRARS